MLYIIYCRCVCAYGRTDVSKQAASTIFSTSQITVTKTLHYVPSASASAGFGISVNGSSIRPTPTNGSVSPAASSAPAPFEGAAKGRGDVELFAAVAWVGVATGFFLLG